MLVFKKPVFKKRGKRLDKYLGVHSKLWLCCQLHLLLFRWPSTCHRAKEKL